MYLDELDYCVLVHHFVTLRQFQARETSQEPSADDWISSEYWRNGLYRLASELGTLADVGIIKGRLWQLFEPSFHKWCEDIVLPVPGLYAFECFQKITAGNVA